jgi:hypothetical protein
MPFDYNAPAELFLAKPATPSRTKYRRFATATEALRYAVETLRTPKAYGACFRSVTSGSTAPTSSAYTKRCGSLRDRAPRACAVEWGPIRQKIPAKRPPPRTFKKEPERATAPYDLGVRCVNAWNASNPRPYLWIGSILHYTSDGFAAFRVASSRRM